MRRVMINRPCGLWFTRSNMRCIAEPVCGDVRIPSRLVWAMLHDMTSTTRKIAGAAAEGTAVNGALAMAWLTVLIFWARRCERHRCDGL